MQAMIRPSLVKIIRMNYLTRQAESQKMQAWRMRNGKDCLSKGWESEIENHDASESSNPEMVSERAEL
jgi:hypothetical protein